MFFGRFVSEVSGLSLFDFFGGYFCTLCLLVSCWVRDLFCLFTECNYGEVIIFCVGPSCFIFVGISFFGRGSRGVCLVSFVFLTFSCVWYRVFKWEEFKNSFKWGRLLQLVNCVYKRYFFNVGSGVEVAFNFPTNNASITIGMSIFVNERVVVCCVLCFKSVRSTDNRVNEGGRVTASITRFV